MSHYYRKILGFTLVELLVSIAIISAISSIVLLNQSTYTDNIALNNLADEIGLNLSQAQAYGIGVREIVPGSGNFTSSYGLTFSLLDSGSNNAYLSFTDKNGNDFYDGDWFCPTGGSSECLGSINISRGNHIDSLCIVRLSQADFCDVGRVDISFNRPSTESQLIFFGTGGGSLVLSDAIGARIMLKSPRGTTQTVTIYKTGQISIGSLYEYRYETPLYTSPPAPPPAPFNYALSYDANITVAQGSSSSNTITKTLLAGTTQAVTLSNSALPTGASASFTSNPCNPTCFSTLTITTTGATPVGTYPVTVTGSPLSKTTTFNLVVTAAVFNYSLSNSGNITVTQGSFSSNTITRTLTTGTTQAVTLSNSALPTGASASFTSNPCNPTCFSTLTITTTGATPVGTYPVTVTGSPLSKTTTFNLVVTVPPPPIFILAGGDTDNQFPFNITGGSNRLLVINASVGNNTGNLTGVTVGSASCHQVGVDVNVDDGDGIDTHAQHTEMWYCDESDFAGLSGTQTITLAGGNTAWATHAVLYTGASQNGPLDWGIYAYTKYGTSGKSTIPIPGVDSVVNGLIVAAWGTGATSYEIGNLTSPLTFDPGNILRYGPDPDSASLTTTIGIEASTNNNKTYSATTFDSLGNIVNYNRTASMAASWAPAP